MTTQTQTVNGPAGARSTRLKIAVVVYADVARDKARVYRALMTAVELLEAGDEVTVVYDGSGTESLAAISDPGHQFHGLAEQLRGVTEGACGFCAKAHGVADAVVAAGYELLADYKDHASLRKSLVEGYSVLTF